MTIERNLISAKKVDYDIIIIGGGIHGVMLALEAGRRSLKTLLVEKSDFGGATTYNSLRLIHGGFRYLQSLDIGRVLESAHERRWYQKHFPQLVKPLACLFPLYGKGLRHPLFFGPALALYNLITHNRNDGLKSDQEIPPAQLVDAQQTRELFPGLVCRGLKKGGVWYDGFMADSQRVLISSLLWASSLGLTALNYARATSLITHKGKVVGICAVDEENGQQHEFRSRIVVNSAGPWCRELAERFDKDNPALFKSMLAWNVLFDRPPLSHYATAVTNGDPSAQTFFAVPWKGKMFVGTGQAPWVHKDKVPHVTEQMLQTFCNDLNIALPGMKFQTDEVVHVYAGLQCATKPGGTKFTKRSVFIDHEKIGGPRGLFSISGIKFTTARVVAEKALGRIFANSEKNKSFPAEPPANAIQTRGVYAYEWFPDNLDREWKRELQAIISEESVIHLDDLLLRRTSIGDNPQRALMLADEIAMEFGWDNWRIDKECQRLEKHYQMSRSVSAWKAPSLIAPILINSPYKSSIQ
jgi:glycerol-3-phosphate dehydrogenase